MQAKPESKPEGRQKVIKRVRIVVNVIIGLTGLQ
jgi:hypothetical protein